jgi:hypothetical protein
MFSIAPYTISLIVASVVSAIILLFGIAVIWQIWTGRINLTYMLSEPVLTAGDKEEPKASLSRFQFLVFTFVIAGLYLVLSIEAGTMVDVPSGALVLLGSAAAAISSPKWRARARRACSRLTKEPKERRKPTRAARRAELAAVRAVGLTPVMMTSSGGEMPSRLLIALFASLAAILATSAGADDKINAGDDCAHIFAETGIPEMEGDTAQNDQGHVFICRKG